jgi:ABC-type histidine transport system ATPase subunit
VTALDAVDRVRVRLGRALALDPAVLLLEHASASVERDQVAALAASMRDAAGRRRVVLVAATADEAFARAVAGRVLTLEPASGRLTERGARWFGGRTC